MTTFRRIVAIVLIASTSSLGLPEQSHAGMLPTEVAVAAGQREHIVNFVNRSDVRAQLQAYGVDVVELNARIAALTDDEAARVAGQIKSLPAGGDGVGGLIGVLVFIFIVLLITDILGLTKVFPFTKPIR